ncbi:putative membrane protein [Thermodesulfovibrio sp. N1]|uniref:sulfite exporter TauE/SafE family protein n=1 Tax=unclassified Thermodesulfovibrio TaxID=2645936 RepID=UPI00083AFB56|nr:MULTISPECIES: sulfite exporter TauE/SafE family protein [unclassified Thermodesulfovibrio]MDI1472136.1 sulfite exporter TauE/SafE family protein [Thermodesulfovibrio sp. 1176]ODA45114.1 putative membrane protein [Thermodesulfovibrio sp. N1]
MSKLRKLYELMMAGAIYQAKWEKQMSDNILKNKKRLLILIALISPILLVSFLGAADFLGGKSAYAPSHYTTTVFIASIAVGLAAGLITGCIGAGGGFIIAPALMAAGVKGILAVGTDQFHIFAKAIMGTVIHKKLGNVCVGLAVAFVIGSVLGATTGGYIQRTIYNWDPVASEAFISVIYAIILGFLGFYGLRDYIKLSKARKKGGQAGGDAHGDAHGGPMTTTQLALNIQKIKIPPMIYFDEDFGGRRISWLFVAACGFLVGILAAVMGVGGGFITFPLFVYVLGVSTPTTVGTDILQIIFTAGYSSITQYAIYGYVFYTLAMGLLLGSLIGIQIGALTTKVVPGMVIRGFWVLTILAGFANRASVIPDKLRSLELWSISKAACDIIILIGNVVFWAAVGGFAVWVIGSFFKNLKALREEG